MFDIAPTKTFKDSVHGYINIPVCFVDNIIDTELFQRLRNIDQTGMRVLYPNAKHDRFGHSLGVFYLGCKAVDSLLANFSSNTYWKISSDNNRAIFWAKNKLLFLLACLLHDIGHTPFSHSLENIVLENSRSGGDTFTQLLIRKINDNEDMGEEVKDLGKAAAHEKMGAMIVLEVFRDKIEQIYKYLNEKKYPQEESKHILYAEHYRNDVVIDTSQLDSDLCFIARMILGLKYQGYEPEKQIRNCFIELLNGDNFDVDKLDYIVRDTKMSGISNIDIDIDRLLGAVCIVLKTKYIDRKFDGKSFSNRTLHKLTNWNGADNELHLKGKFSGTLILGQDAKVVMAQNSTFASLEGSREDTTIQFDGDHVSANFKSDTVIYQDGELIYKENNGIIRLTDTKNSIPFKVKMKDATCVSENNFVFWVRGKGNMELQINGYCDVTVKGNCRAEAEISFYEPPIIEGTIHEAEFLGNEIEETLPTCNIYNTFSVGFRKQALSIIANVLEARNYLYLWIYAHHKVTYYANFLVPAISNNLLSSNNNTEFPYWNLSYQNIAYLDDAYVWTVIRGCKLLKVSPQVERLCQELLSRNYKKSLFKSLAEYDLLFEAFTDEQKSKLKRKLADAVDKNNLCVMEDSVVTAGFIRDEILTELRKKEGVGKVESMVYVDVGYMRKHLNTHETFIDMHGKAISVDKILLLANKKNLANQGKLAYFYLYYGSSAQTTEEKKRENEAIKQAIKEYFIEQQNDE